MIFLCILFFLIDLLYRAIFTFYYFRFNIPKSALHDSVTNVCKLMLQLEGVYVSWLSPEEQEIEAATFNSWAGIYTNTDTCLVWCNHDSTCAQ